MAITLNGTTGISSPGGDTSTSLATTNLSYTGTLTGGTGVIAIGTTQIYKDASGNVGIGTASPGYKLDIGSFSTSSIQTIRIAAATGNDSQLKLMEAADTYGFTIRNANGSGLNILRHNADATGATTLFISRGTGDIGIGTPSPSYRLDVSGGDINVAANSFYRIGAGTDRYIQYRSANADILYSFSSGNFYRQDITNSAHTWYTGNTERARIDSSGNLLVGSTSAVAGFTSQISSTGPTTNRGCVIAGRTTAATSGVCGSIQSFNGSQQIAAIDFVSNGANNNGLVQVYTWSAGTGVSGPYVNTGGTSWTTASDEKLKDISGVIENALEKTASLRAIEYTLKSDPSKMERVGLVAQEVQKVLPQAVSVDPEGFLGVQYTDTIPLLVAAIKELTTRLEALEAKA